MPAFQLYEILTNILSVWVSRWK